MNEGVVLLASDGVPELATPPACALFGCRDLADLRQQWQQLGAPLWSATPGPATNDVTSLDLDLPGGDGMRRLRIEVLPETSPNGQRLAMVTDREAVDTLDGDFRAATQLRTFSRLSASIAHDLKAPLAAVLLHLELLRGTLARDECEGQAPQQRQLRYVGVMKDELARLNKQLTSLFTHIAVRKDEPETFDLRDIIQELDFLVRPQAQRQSVSLEIAVVERPANVRGSRNALRQAVLNVAVNALEAMPDGGKLQITLDHNDAAATIAVRDTGTGISPAAHASMYDARYTTKPGADGMGLYVTRSVLAHHGGSVRAETADPGTRFVLAVPSSA